MNKEITETEWELIEALRNFRKSKHSSPWQFELWIDQLVEQLKDQDE